MSDARAAFLDRDGIVCELVPDPQTHLPESPLHVADVTLVPGAAAALRRLSEAGWLLVGVSNQPGAAKGKVTWAEIEATHERVMALLGDAGVRFAGTYLCPHHPDGTVPGLSGPCDCRKPKPGMLLTAARELGIGLRDSWMVGDTDSDVAAGQAAGCHSVLVEYPGSWHKRLGGARPDVSVHTVTEAVDVILGQADVNSTRFTRRARSN